MIDIAGFFARLNKNEKRVLALAAAFVAAAFLDRAVLGPVLGKLRALDERIVERVELIRKNARIVAEKDRVEASAKNYNTFGSKAATPEEEVAALLGEVEILARKASLYIIDMKPLPPQEDKVSRVYSVDLNCEAQMDQLVTFMHDVESAPRLLFVETFSISPKSKDSSLAKCNMKISNIVFP